MIALAVVAGISIGFVGGVLFSRWDQGRAYGLIVDTVDKITTAALFPGLKGIADTSPAVESRAFDTVDVDEQEGAVRVPAWLDEGSRSPAEPWDYTEAPEEAKT